MRLMHTATPKDNKLVAYVAEVARLMKKINKKVTKAYILHMCRETPSGRI
jgi:hypothetical protein